MEPLSGLDAFFLYSETESMHMHIAMTGVLDVSTMKGGYSYEKVVEHIGKRLHLVPALSRKLVNTPMDIHHPYWVKDENFRLINHIRHVHLPKPGGPEDLGRMVGEIASVPLDRSRPLWEIWLIEGLYDGNVGLVAKLHHSLVDGVSGVDLLVAFFDFDAEPTEVDVPPPSEVDPPPSEIEILKSAAAQRWRLGSQLVPLLRRTLGGVTTVRRLRNTTDLPSGGTPLTAPRTHFNRTLTPNRNVAFSDLSLTEIRELKDRTGGTVNDVVLAICSGALRSYLATHDEVPDKPLIASCPISVRGEDEQGAANNRLSAMIASLPTHLADPLDRLEFIKTNTQASKREHNLVGDNLLADWADVMDPTVFSGAMKVYGRSGLADKHPPIQNLLISNMRGPEVPVYLAGAQLVRAYPMGPILEGAGLNITLWSYVDNMDIGFICCDDLMPKVWDLADAVKPAFDELKEAAAGR